jgi:hypothetical protein
MQQKQLTVLCQAVVSCTLGILGLQMLHSVAPAAQSRQRRAQRPCAPLRRREA